MAKIQKSCKTCLYYKRLKGINCCTNQAINRELISDPEHKLCNFYSSLKISNIISKGIKPKVYFQRATTYLAVLNFFMILYVALNNLKDNIGNINVEFLVFPVFLLVMIIMILIGYADEKLGLFKKEQTIYSDNNEHFINIKKELEEIKNKLK